MNFIQRIKCWLGWHEWKATHFGLKRNGEKVIYRSCTLACPYCGKHGKKFEVRYD